MSKMPPVFKKLRKPQPITPPIPEEHIPLVAAVKAVVVEQHVLRNMVITSLVTAVVGGTISLAGTIILGSRLHEYKIQVDSQLTKLLQLNKTAAYEQGATAGVKGERDYQNDQDRKDDATKLRGPEGPTGPRGPKGKSE